MRVGLEHLGQSVLFCVSMTFLRSPVLAIFAIVMISLEQICGLLRRGCAVCAGRPCLILGLGLWAWAEQEGQERMPGKALLQVYTIVARHQRSCGYWDNL